MTLQNAGSSTAKTKAQSHPYGDARNALNKLVEETAYGINC